MSIHSKKLAEMAPIPIICAQLDSDYVSAGGRGALQNILQEFGQCFGIFLHRAHFVCLAFSENECTEIDPFFYYKKIGSGDLFFNKGGAALRTPSGRVLKKI